MHGESYSTASWSKLTPSFLNALKTTAFNHINEQKCYYAKPFFRFSDVLQLKLLLMLFFLTWLAGCTATSALATAGQLASIAMDMAGVKKPGSTDSPDAQSLPRQVKLRLHAGHNLNSGGDGKPVSLLVRVYKLKQADGFRQAAYSTFLDPARERETMGTDLLEVKEILLIPGQQLEITEKVAAEATHVGVVALFRSPSPARWKATFVASNAETSGITLGAHACAMSSRAGASSLEPLAEQRLSAALPCGR